MCFVHAIQDNYYEISDRNNTEPDFDDPEWYKKVTDWGEFWNHTKWDLETEGLEPEEEEVDAAGNPVKSMERLWMLLQAIKDIDGRPDVINWMPPMVGCVARVLHKFVVAWRTVMHAWGPYTVTCIAEHVYCCARNLFMLHALCIIMMCTAPHMLCAADRCGDST